MGNTTVQLSAGAAATGHVAPLLPGLSVREHVLHLALPAVGEQMLNLMVGLVGTFLVGHLGKTPLAAVGLGDQWVMLVSTVLAAISVGSTVLVARAVGGGDIRLANGVTSHSVTLAVLAGLFIAGLGLAFAPQAMRLLGAEPNAAILGAQYLRVVALTVPLAALLFVGNACLRGAGDTRTPLKVMLVANGVNVLTAYSFIYGAFGLPKLGVVGAALGAAVGRGLGGVLVLIMLMRGRSWLRLTVRSRTMDWDVVWRILNVGLPAGGEQLLMRIGQMIYARIVASLGTAAYGAHVIALSSESISFLPGFGFATAASTLVSQALGAGKAARAEQYVYASFRVAAAVMSAMGVLFLLFARPFVSVFTSEPDVIALGTPPLRFIALAQPFLAGMMVFGGSLRGAGDTTAAMLITGAGNILVRVPLALFIVHGLGGGLTGAWVAMAVDLCARCAMAWLRLRSGRWKRIRV